MKKLSTPYVQSFLEKQMDPHSLHLKSKWTLIVKRICIPIFQFESKWTLIFVPKKQMDPHLFTQKANGHPGWTPKAPLIKNHWNLDSSAI